MAIAFAVMAGTAVIALILFFLIRREVRTAREDMLTAVREAVAEAFRKAHGEPCPLGAPEPAVPSSPPVEVIPVPEPVPVVREALEGERADAATQRRDRPDLPRVGDEDDGDSSNASPGGKRDTPTEPSASAPRARPLHEVAELDAETIARVDALAAKLGVSREEALVLCAERGVEEMLGPPSSGRKGRA